MTDTRQLTENEKAMLAYLDGQKEFVSPTKIGLAFGHTSGGQQRHSSWASPICKRLVEKGYLERSPRGWYRPITNVTAFRITPNVCAYCVAYRAEDAYWFCGDDEERAGGDVGEGIQMETTCAMWRKEG